VEAGFGALLAHKVKHTQADGQTLRHRAHDICVSGELLFEQALANNQLMILVLMSLETFSKKWVFNNLLVVSVLIGQYITPK